MNRNDLGGERRQSVLGRRPAFSKPTGMKRGEGGGLGRVSSSRTLGEVVWPVAFIFGMMERMLSKC